MNFNYMILQAVMTILSIIQKINVFLQIGGSDQWGNIVNGVELIRKMLKKRVFWTYYSTNYFSIWCKNGQN